MKMIQILALVATALSAISAFAGNRVDNSDPIKTSVHQKWDHSG